MAQARSFTRVSLLAPTAAALSAAITTGTAADLSTYADVGRREFRVYAAVSGMEQPGTTSVAIVIQDNTTSTAGDSGWATVSSSGALAFTTNGVATDIFVRTNKRYLRAVSTPTALTASYHAVVQALVSNRVS
jgi:hypothetical protein